MTGLKVSCRSYANRGFVESDTCTAGQTGILQPERRNGKNSGIEATTMESLHGVIVQTLLVQEGSLSS